ncbi:MAG: hypothetical protein QNJ40_15475 [Xanthomonadales bacterium]|nr:hypothetical protein [Xanthomonadales bacterium]
MKLITAMMALTMLAGVTSQSLAGPNCPEPVMVQCDVRDQFPEGRWSFSDAGSQYLISGTEPLKITSLLHDSFLVEGALEVYQEGGPEANYIEVDCDGRVSGRGQEQIAGVITKTAQELACEPMFNGDGSMRVEVALERTYRIDGFVDGPGRLELTRTTESAAFHLNGRLSENVDCSFRYHFPDVNLNISEPGRSDRVWLQIDYDGEALPPRYDASILPIEEPWLEDVARRIILGRIFSFNPRMLLPDEPLPSDYERYNVMFLRDEVSLTPQLNQTLIGKTPVIRELTLAEPKHYLEGVFAMTRLTADVDWRDSDSPREITFEYPAGIETTLMEGEPLELDFNAGDPTQFVDVKVRGGDEVSPISRVSTPAVTMPHWAAAASGWSAQPGIQYSADANWPISEEATRTVNTLSFLTGIWGLSGTADSEYILLPHSDGMPRTGNADTEISIRFAGRASRNKLKLTGHNTTTLGCDSLQTAGETVAEFPDFDWQQTLNPLTLIPPVAALCAANPGGIICGVINSFGVKLNTRAGVNGILEFAGSAMGNLEWTGASLASDFEVGVALELVPKPLHILVSFSVEGGGGGCMLFDVAPTLNVSGLGGKVYVRAEANLLFVGAGDAEKEWTFGDACLDGSPGSTADKGTAPGWVPDDGQLAMALGPEGQAAAVWTEPHPGENRPSGDIVLRAYRQGQWQAPVRITDDVQSDIGPSVIFENQHRVWVSYMRNDDTLLPSSAEAAEPFAGGFEQVLVAVDLQTGQMSDPLQVTANSVVDFGGTLHRDGAGGLHLLWQRSDARSFTGSSSDPAGIYMTSLDGGKWSQEQTVADGLVGLFGWTAAAGPDGDLAVAMILDEDGDLSTPDDREAFTALRRGGAWAAPVNLSRNAVMDDSPLVGFDANGEPATLWRSQGQVWQATGPGDPAPALDSGDEELDDAVDVRVSRGWFDAAAGVLVWPDGNRILSARQSEGEWSATRTVLADTSGSLELHDVRLQEDQMTIAYSSRHRVAGGFTLEPLALPRFTSVSLDECSGVSCDRLFENGFEQAGNGQ